ncbi:EAL domain-containing protein [Geobacter sulfurreducens]|uniref:putative bifunctional diguanylate cyclase/phosphodiesterase n=1 Tax=Geobacter sulfurreducens TaxID=35554 RepID=UPI001BDD369F|nr:EAL domain-containing protein [Geobacter sulfurreducens]QVW33880.1 EAL domain-containing protein [Geobacter sulfurreducens]
MRKEGKDGASATVMIIDDDELVRVLARRAVEQGGFAVIEAGDGVTAIEMFSRLVPDIILLDVVMPGMGGFDVCRRIRRLPGGDRVQILVMTSLDDTGAIDEAYEAGASDFLAKPIDWVLLPRRIRYLLRAKLAFDELHKSRTMLYNAQRIARLGNWEFDLETNVFTCSEESCRIFGIRDHRQGKSHRALMRRVHPEDRVTVKKAIFQAFRTGVGYCMDHRIVLDDGVERIVSQHAELLSADDGRTSRLVGTVHDITERTLAEERIRYLAHHDTLTALPNRFQFEERMEQALAFAQRNGFMMAVLFLDLDHFKKVNDTLGHHAGDRLLQDAAGRLMKCLRRSDTLTHASREDASPFISRMGGDEFTILLTDLAHPQDAARVSQRIITALSKRYVIGGHEVFVGASIGISLFPSDGEDCDQLLRNADTAMYHAKELGRNTYQYYSGSMNAMALERLTLENNLRWALKRNEFRLCYQPQLDAASGRVVGMEALLSWHRPGCDVVPPDDFIPLAEETGLIASIGEWVLWNACAQAVTWLHEGLPPVRVAVNLSSLQFRSRRLAELVRKVLRATGLPPSHLELEITEGVFMSNEEDAAVVIRDLKKMGVRFSVDDFGTGYSSLSRLSRFPLDALKIDRSFVRDISADPAAAGLTAAIIAMARNLGLNVIAEGVETHEQFAFLRANGCAEVQGFLFSQPLNPDAAAAFLRARSR